MDPILDQIPCGYLEFNDEGTLGRVNKNLCEMLGFDRDELEKRHIDTILTPASRVFYQTHLFPLLKTEKQFDEIYLTTEAKNGDKIPVLINAERITQNVDFRNRCIMVEIKRRSEYEDRILYAKEEAESTRDRKEKMLSMMSHELRSPLNVILGMVDLLSEDLNGDVNSDQSKYLGLIKNAGKELARLADDILNFAKLESGYFSINKEIFILEEVLMSSFMMVMQDAEEKKIKLTRSEKTELKVRADKGRLQQVLINLLTNAVKYTKPNGAIELHTEKDGQFINIQVKDTGIGIPEDKIEDIFNPFTQINEKKSGSESSGFGLGLPITKKLVELMDGKLMVSSEVGKGSVFSVRIPLANN